PRRSTTAPADDSMRQRTQLHDRDSARRTQGRCVSVSPAMDRAQRIALHGRWPRQTAKRAGRSRNGRPVHGDAESSAAGLPPDASHRGGDMDLWIHDFRTAADSQLTSEKDIGPVSAPAWSPDGLQVAYLVNRRTLHVIDVVGAPAQPGKRLIGGSGPLGRPTW